MASKSKRRALLTLLSVVVIDLIGFGIVIPILPFYVKALEATATQLGIIMASYAAMQLVFAPFWGFISDRYGRKPVILFTLAGTSLSLLMLGLSSSLAGILVARLLGGFFGANISVATAYISDLAEDKERTRWMGLIGAAFGIGFILGPFTGGVLAPWGYAVPLLLASALAAINLIYAAFTLMEPRRLVETVEEAKAGVAAAKVSLLRNSRVLRLCSLYFIFTFGITQLEVLFAYFMLDRFDYGAKKVGFILAYMAVVMVAVQGGGIRPLAKKFGEKKLLLAGGLILAATIAPLPWIPTVPLLLIPLGFSSIGRGIAHPAMLTLVSEGSTQRNRGAVMGIFQASGSLARVFSPLVAGILYDLRLWSPFVLAAFLMIAVWALGLGVKTSSGGQVAVPAEARERS